MFKIIFANFHLEKILWIIKSKMKTIIVFALIGAIIGDIVGSRFEWHNIKSKDFDFFTNECKPTDNGGCKSSVYL